MRCNRQQPHSLAAAMATELVGWWGADVDSRIPMKYYFIIVLLHGMKILHEVVLHPVRLT